MGSLRYQKISDAEIVRCYAEGNSQGLISLKARISTAQVRDILVANHVRLRGQQESLRLALRGRSWNSTRRMHKRLGRA